MAEATVTAHGHSHAYRVKVNGRPGPKAARAAVEVAFGKLAYATVVFGLSRKYRVTPNGARKLPPVY